MLNVFIGVLIGYGICAIFAVDSYSKGYEEGKKND